MFFICIPYASIFTHYSVLYFFPNLQLSEKVTRYLSISLFFISIVVLILNTEKWYTFINLIVFTGLLAYSFITKITILQKFYITFIVILIPFFIMSFFLIKRFKFKISLKDKKLLFLIFINLIPIALMFLTSFITGSKIRTMWMTPFYLFFGVLIVYIFQAQINLKKLKLELTTN